MVVTTRSGPEENVDDSRIRAVAQQWPVFRKYDKRAAFQRAVTIDYSAAWGIPAEPPPAAGPIANAVGPPDEFIQRAPEHAKRFEDWLRERGLSAGSEEQWRAVLRDHGSVIRDERMVVPAIAAYGEDLRRRIDGVWRKAAVVNRGEPVVARKGQPWSSRRVILEVLEALDAVEEG